MKKNFMIALVAAAAISFSACNSGTSGSGSSDAADSTKVETSAAPAVEAPAETNAVDKYAEIVEKAIALQEKIKAGDAVAIEEASKLGKEAMDLASEIQKELPNMTAEQQAKFQEAAKKALESVQPK